MKTVFIPNSALAAHLDTFPSQTLDMIAKKLGVGVTEVSQDRKWFSPEGAGSLSVVMVEGDHDIEKHGLNNTFAHLSVWRIIDVDTKKKEDGTWYTLEIRVKAKFGHDEATVEDEVMRRLDNMPYKGSILLDSLCSSTRKDS